jgi:hypothetical protein
VAIIADEMHVLDTYRKLFAEFDNDPVATIVNGHSPPDRAVPLSSSVPGADRDVVVKKTAVVSQHTKVNTIKFGTADFHVLKKLFRDAPPPASASAVTATNSADTKLRAAERVSHDTDDLIAALDSVAPQSTATATAAAAAAATTTATATATVAASAEELFLREPVLEYRPSTVLKDLIAAMPAQKSKAEMQRPLKLRVSVKGSDDKYQFVNVEVPAKAKVQHVIEEVLKEAAKQRNILFRNTNPTAYQLMLADSDGVPDEDFAVALGQMQNVARFNANTFALLKDQRQHEEDEANEPKFTVASEYSGFAEFQVLKVHLPDSSYVHLPYKPETQNNKLLINVCRRRNLPATEYTFVDPDDLQEIDLQQTLGDIGLGELQCIRKADLAEARKARQSQQQTTARTKKTGPLFFLTPAIAAQYKTYPVIKVNPYGVKQKRMMGIDATRITNFKPGKEDKDRAAALEQEAESAAAAASSSSSSQAGATGATAAAAAAAAAMADTPTKSRKSFIGLAIRKDKSAKENNPNTKHPMRLISEILECELRPKSNVFFIRYTDKLIEYESPQADEIVAKIQMLQAMHKKSAVQIL